jgi:hypothetical protein
VGLSRSECDARPTADLSENSAVGELPFCTMYSGSRLALSGC